jgi:hypothetical protein
MHKIRKTIITDKAQRRVAVQIDYKDWLKIERSLNLHDEEPEVADLSRYYGVISLEEEPLAYQARIRNEWS